MDGCMLIANEVWSDEWFCSLDQRYKLLYLYLLGNCSKCGVFEMNIRKINFDLTNGVERVKPYTSDELLEFAGERIKSIGGNKAIILRYIEFNWMRDKPLDPEKNPLHRGLAQELAKYGLSFEKLNKMYPKCNLKWKEGENDGRTVNVYDTVVAVQSGRGVKTDDYPYEMWFDSFWKMYPGPRKTDKKKCHDKFLRILKAEKAPDHLFEKIMGGLNMWMSSDDWQKDGGQYICAPLVWLNNERWDAEIKKGVKHGSFKRVQTANANCQSTETDGLF